MTDPCKHRWIGDLKTIEMQDGEHSPVGYRIQELVRMPCCGEGSGLCLAVADHAGSNEIGIVEDSTERMGERIPELSSFVDGPWRLRGSMTRNATRERELLEELLHALGIPGYVGIKFAVRTFQICVGYHAGTSMPGAADEDNIEVMGLDQAVKMHVDEVEPRCRAPVSQQPGFYVLQLQGLLEQRIVIEIDLSDRKVVCRTPVCVHGFKLFRGERVRHRNLLFECLDLCMSCCCLCLQWTSYLLYLMLKDCGAGCILDVIIGVTCNHQFFVGFHHPNSGRAPVPGYYGGILPIEIFIETDSQKLHVLTDAL